jgi:hypothetical protein
MPAAVPTPVPEGAAVCGRENFQVFDSSWWEVATVGMRGESTAWRQRLLFAMVLGALLGLVGWALPAAAGPDREWVALLWLVSAAGLVLMLTTMAARRDATNRRLGAAGLLVTGVSVLTVVLTGGIAGALAIPFLPLLIAYTALLITSGEEVPPQAQRHRIAAGGVKARATAPPGAPEAAAKRAGPEQMEHRL